MMNITERVSYLRGLAKGMELKEDTKESKLILEMIEILDDIALVVSDLEEGFDDVSNRLDVVDEDLEYISEDVYGNGCGCGCGCCDDVVYEAVCPNCNEELEFFEDEVSDGVVKCHNCGEELELDFDEVCDEDCKEKCSCHDVK